MIRLVIDSTCDMPQDLISKYHSSVLPLSVSIGNESFRDGVDIQIDRLYSAMRQGILPQTSQISPSETESIFRSICEEGDDMIYLSFSSGMSGTFQLAKLIAEDLSREFPERRLEVVDSEGGSIATGIIAMQTARWISSGKSFEEVVSLLNEAVSKIQHLFTLDSLNWLAKGGRIAKPAGYVGDKLQIKPILHVADKTMHVIRIVRGRKQTLSALVDMLVERCKDMPKQLIGIAHADDLSVAEEVAQMIHKVLPEAKTFILPIGCVLGSHIGIGGVGLFFFREPLSEYDLLSEEL
ncbi:MAG: DegV family protein [Eubacteriales bacterium]|nr:DegV family protein [Eubacteriales bacterium]